MNEIICAPATAPVSSALAVIRISGEGAGELASNIFSAHAKMGHGKSVYGMIKDGTRVIDDVVLTFYKGPASFTGEDTVEISCHGNTIIVKNIIQLLLKSGARLAEPGEFSRRAFLNGKLDLTEAEAINHLICARSDWEIDAAIGQMHGTLKSAVHALREKLILIKADIESAIDFSQEEIEFISREEALAMAREIKTELDSLMRRCALGSKISEGIDLPIVGKPNSGKSSLMNLILNQDRAIVSSIPGTTRDMIKETVQLGGIHVNLYDTAGIREAECEIERIGISKSESILNKASVVIVMIDAQSGLDDEDYRVLELAAGKNAIVLLNKTDIAGIDAALKLSETISVPTIPFSAKNGDGLKELELKIRELLQSELPEMNNFFLADMRITNLLNSSNALADSLINAISRKEPDEILAYEIQSLIAALSEITGDITADDVLDSIFSRFCIGK